MRIGLGLTYILMCQTIPHDAHLCVKPGLLCDDGLLRILCALLDDLVLLCSCLHLQSCLHSHVQIDSCSITGCHDTAEAHAGCLCCESCEQEYLV